MTGTDMVDAAFDMAAAETGVQNDRARLRCRVAPAKIQARHWTQEEDDFLRENLGKIPETEIARRLRRTLSAVHIRWNRELHLQPPSKRSDVLTAESVAVGVGKDGKTIHMLIDRGILPGRRLPTNGRVIRLVDRRVLVRWLLDPGNWCYIQPDRIGELRPQGKRRISSDYDFAFWEDAARVVQAAYRRWKDAWLTPGRVAKMLHLSNQSRYVNKAIHKGNLQAVRWGNWWIRKSWLPRGKTINYCGEWVKQV